MSAQSRSLCVVLALGLLAAACTSNDGQSESGATPTAAVTATSTAPPLSGTTDSDASPTLSAAADTEAPSGAAEPSAADIVLPVNLVVTPSQGEGPYYPDDDFKPDERDNNLLVVAGRDPPERGTPLEISGLLVLEDGSPVTGATIEIWQVDGQGLYDHRRAPNTEDRDMSFQFYGESVTDSDGFWTFLTLDPVLYESRPRHVHAKVIVDGEEVLTTQIYFEGDALLASDSLAATAGDDLVLLTTNTTEGTLSNGLDGLIATHVIVLAS